MAAFLKIPLLLFAVSFVIPCILALPLSSHRDLMHPFKRQNDPALAQRYEEILSNVQLNKYASTLYQNFRSKNVLKVFLRKPYLNLAEAIKTVKGQLTSNAAQIYLYADLLQFAGDVAVEMPKRTTLYLFTREVSALATQKGAMTIKYDQSVVIYFATPQLSANFAVSFVDQNGNTQKLTLTVPPEQYGLLVEVKSGVTAKVSHLSSPDFALEAFDYMGDLSLTESTFVEDDLPRLLQFQQVLATAWKNTNPEIAMDIYHYIVKTARTSPAARVVYQQAVSSMEKLRMITDPLQQYVPNLDITQIKSVVDEHLEVAKTFEDSFNRFAQMEYDAKEAKAAAQDAFTNSKLAAEKFKFLETQAKTRLESAVKAMNDAVDNYKETYDSLALKYATYESGIAKFATDQAGKMILEVTMAVFQIVSTIAAAGIGAAAAAPAAASGGASTVSGIAGARNVVMKAAAAIPASPATGKTAKQIEAASASAKYMIDNISKGVTTLAGTVANLHTLLGTTLPELELNGFDIKSTEPFGQVIGATERIDVINLSTKWDEWRDLNELYWNKMPDSQKDIQGASDYYAALYSLSSCGKAIVAAQAAYVEVFDNYMEASANLKTAEAQTAVLENAIARLQDPLVFQTFKRAMFDRLIAVRSWVAIEFNDYAAAFQYYTLTSSPPKSVQVLSPASFYAQAVAELQGTATHAQTSFRSQTQTFTLSSTDETNHFGTNWKNELKSSAGLTFSIPTDSSHFSKVSRVRVQKIRCYFIGSGADEIRTTLTISGAFEDKGLSYPYNPLKFISDSTPLGFHYAPSKNDPKELNPGYIHLDGTYARKDVFMTPTPFASWNIQVEDSAKALRGVKKMVILIEAEVTRH